MKRVSLFLFGLMSLCVSMLALANDGLGSSAPNSANVSVNSQYAAYHWTLNGVNYVQVNDLSGNVLFAVAAGGGEVLVLPTGNPNNVHVLAATSSGVTIYSDATVTIAANSTGFTASPATSTSSTSSPQVQTLSAAATCTNPSNCSYAGAGGN